MGFTFQVEEETHFQPQPSEERPAEEVKETNVEMVEDKPASNEEDSGNRRLTRTKAKVEAKENRRLTRTKAKLEEEVKPSTPEDTGNRRLTRAKKAKVLSRILFYRVIFNA